MTTPPEDWQGDFGSGWFARNLPTHSIIEERAAFFDKELPTDIKSILEFGSGWGTNLLALQSLNKKLTLEGIEVNSIGKFYCTEQGIYVANSFKELFTMSNLKHDLVFTCAALIHLDEDDLKTALNSIVEASSPYVLLMEYWSHNPIMILYHGKPHRLWKRDYGKCFMEQHGKDFHHIKCGFLWDYDWESFDNVHWWLFERI